MSVKKHLTMLLRRPQEPVFAITHDNGRRCFNLPDELLTDRHQTLCNLLKTKNGSAHDELMASAIPVKTMKMPDLSVVTSLGRDEQFSLWIPRHKKLAALLIGIFMETEDLDDLLSVAIYARDRVNPLLFHYALSVVLMHRPDTKRMELPSFLGAFPDRFVDPKVMAKLLEEATMVEDPGNRIPVTIPQNFTYSDEVDEHKLAYFREDIGANLHHWHWHLVYPYGPANYGLVDKDRRGELFYYMHGQFVARYNLERYSHKMPKAVSYSDFKEPIPLGYYPKLESSLASRGWPGRPDNMQLRNLERMNDGIQLTIADLEMWRKRFFEAIDQGYVVTREGNKLELDEEKGIDILGNMMEASEISPDIEFYGDLHNGGHLIISFSHDPDGRFLEPQGIMGNAAVAMRDPVFYRWHSYVDDIFQMHKAKLSPYTAAQLAFPRITATKLSVASKSRAVNTLHTCWEQSDVDFSHGLDFVLSKGSVFARVTHLSHEPFNYTINVTNDGDVCEGMVRIFLLPETDELGNMLSFNELRLLAIEMDRFVAKLNPGENIIRRRDTDSTVTISYERTFRNYAAKEPPEETPEFEQYNYCGCGWPAHLLIPKGSTDGFKCLLFVMVSNYDEDRVVQSLDGVCNDAASFCGIRDRKYPDRKAMGYPFDRLAREGCETLDDFLTPNMCVQRCTVFHTDTYMKKSR